MLTLTKKYHIDLEAVQDLYSTTDYLNMRWKFRDAKDMYLTDGNRHNELTKKRKKFTAVTFNVKKSEWPFIKEYFDHQEELIHEGHDGYGLLILYMTDERLMVVRMIWPTNFQWISIKEYNAWRTKYL